MPDPISSSSLFPAALTSSDLDSDPALMSSQPPALPEVAGAEASKACELPAVPPEQVASSAPSALAQRFLVKDHSALIANSSTPSEPPSAPAALTVRPGQLDFQTGIPRFESHATVGDLHLSAAVDVLNVGAHVGRLNEDRSHGANVGWGANLLNGELTLDYRGWSLSVGAGESLGGSIASGGERDADGDGVQERCFKMTLGPFTLGECDEL